MKLLFDTNIIIAFLKNDKEIVRKIKNYDIAISAITAGELLYGIENSARKVENLRNYNSFVSLCKIYPVDEDVAKVYSEIRYALKEKGMPVPENDIWIMATAKHNGLIIVTRDEHILKHDLVESLQW